MALKSIVDDRLSELLLENFSSDEQQLFVKSFKTYLEYGNDDNAFVIDFDDVWKWIGFTRKDNAKTLLLKHFTKEVHYIEKTLALRKNRGGHNKEILMLNVNTFKDFCMIANTTKAKIIRGYYINILHHIISSPTSRS